jgi:hypothetical protein
LDPKIWAKLQKEVSEDGRVFRRINYDLRMISDGSCLEFAIWYNDQCLASQHVDFESTQMEREEPTNGGDNDDVQMSEPQETASELYPVIELDDSDDEYVDCPDHDDESSSGDRSTTVRGRQNSQDGDFLSE